MSEALVILFVRSLQSWLWKSNRAKKEREGGRERGGMSCLLHTDESWSVCKLSEESKNGSLEI